MATSDRARFAGRNGEVWAAYVRGLSQEAIATKFSISQQRVSQIINKVRDEIPQQVKEETIVRSIELLVELRRQMMELVDAAPIPAYSQGRPILLDDGETVAEDHSGRLSAVDRVLRIEERAAKLLGLDMPTQSQVSSEGTVRFEVVGVDLDAIE